MSVNLVVKQKNDREDSGQLIKRFLRKFKKEKILDDILKKRFFEKPSVIKHRKKELKKYRIEQQNIKRELQEQEDLKKGT